MSLMCKLLGMLCCHKPSQDFKGTYYHIDRSSRYKDVSKGTLAKPASHSAISVDAVLDLLVQDKIY